MKNRGRKNWKRWTGDFLWLLLLLAAVVLVGVSLLGNRTADLTDITARRTGRIIDRRMALLDTYIDAALHQEKGQWLDLHRLPEDMVIYRYEADSLQSWCHQFTTDNDDISRRVLFPRFTNLRYSMVSPLAQADTAVSYLNIGPRWYLVKSRSQDDCRVIAGLEIRNTSDGTSLSGVNPRLRVSDRFSVHPVSATGGTPIRVQGRPLLKLVQENPEVLPLFPSGWAVWVASLLVVAGILLFLYTHRGIRSMFLSVLGLLTLLGILSLLGRGVHAASGLFSPTVYADGRLFRSLGSLILFNAFVYLAVVCLYLTRKDLMRFLSRRRPAALTLASCVLIVLAVLIALHTHFSLRSIIMNSNINLELYKINLVSWYTVLVYVSYVLLIMTIPLIFQMLRPFLRRHLGWRYNVFSPTSRALFSVLAAGYLLVVSSILGFRREENRVDIWANRMAVDRNLAFELQLRGVENAIANDPLITSLLPVDKDYRVILSRISENYLSRIASDYDVSVYIFKDNEIDPKVMALLGERILSGTPIADNSRFRYSRSAAGRAQYTGTFVYYSGNEGVTNLLLGIESKMDKESRGYSVLLRGTGGGSGSVVIPPRYSYAKYLDDKLVSFKGNYAYPTLLAGKLKEIGGEETRYVTSEGYVHFVTRISEEETIVISRSNERLVHYMVAGFILVLLFYSAISFPGIRRKRRGVFEKNYYKTRINTLLLSSLLVTLLVMAAISILFVYNRNETNVRNLMIGKIGTIQSLVEAGCRYFTDIREFDNQEMTGVLRDIGDYTKSDISLYTTGGKIFKSTAPEVFERLLIGSRTDPDAYRNIMYRHRRFYIHKEKVGSHSYYSMYAPVFNGNGQMLAILNAPYTDPGADFRMEAVFHSIFILTAFCILLIIARLLSTKMVDKMFGPLTEMGAKMTAARSGGLEYIIYDRDDEISTVVRAYNLMVHDLSESGKQVAQAERDKAWSEMARQIAHEIKNPLTPIKLQIQRIIRLRQKGDPQWQEKFDTIVPVIMDSIDGLTETANEFSTFARLYSEEPVEIDLDALIRDEVALFDEKDTISIQYMGLAGARVQGPKPQLTRVIVNLLTNAVQAVENQQEEEKAAGQEPRPGRIVVSLRNSSRDGFYDIVVEDNGPGVRDENRSRLFTPNFTTKSSGTGLGLAICKNILERCGGEIRYSRSFALQGACFTVRFPKG